MKSVTVFVFFVVLVLPAIISCASTGSQAAGSATSGGQATGGSRTTVSEGGTSFNDVSGKEWILAEIRSARSTIQIDRQKLAANNIGGFFTINFQEGNVSGMGAPNRFRGPYTLGSGNALNIGLLATTMMAAFIEADELKEHEYHVYLGKVTRWNLRSGNLELTSSNPEGAEAILVFRL